MVDDIFSEDLVDTPDDIERVIEGGGDEQQYDSEAENNNEDNNKTEDKENDKSKPKRKLGPRVNLNLERLRGPRGIQDIDSFFKDIKLTGKKGTEKQDLKLIMSRLKHWAFRLMPRMEFQECIQKIEKLGSKREIANYMKRVRMGLEDFPVTSEQVVENDVEEINDPVADEPTATSDTERSRDQVLRERIIHEDLRAARLARAQELKRKFQEDQAKKLQESQSENVGEHSSKKLSQSSIAIEEKNEETPQQSSAENLLESPVHVVEENQTSNCIENHLSECLEKPYKSAEDKEEALQQVKKLQESQCYTADYTSEQLTALGTEPSRDQVLRERIVHEDLRAARLARAQELKRKFQEDQAKKIQGSQSGNVEENSAKKMRQSCNTVDEENEETPQQNSDENILESQVDMAEENQTPDCVENQLSDCLENQSKTAEDKEGALHQVEIL